MVSVPPPLIVTRPEPEASRWVQAVQAQGGDAVALPLIEIAPRTLPVSEHPRPGHHAALMFVSGAAVRTYFSQVPRATMAPGTRCWCTGPGTAGALRDAGVPEADIDTPPVAGQQFDSEALWALVHAQVRAGTRVCIVRGGDAQGRAAGRDWLARTLDAAGADLDTVVPYRRLPPRADAQWTARLHDATAKPGLWLFSSSEAVANLRAASVRLAAPRWRECRALATHGRIAEAARELGFGQVRLVAPLLASVLAALAET